MQIERVDHGVRSLEDPMLLARLARDGIPLTVCPCSNHRLQVNRRFFGGENPTRQLLTKGLKVTLNSDDPAYFFGHTDKYGTTHGGYVDSCYRATARECGLTADECVLLARNSLEATFASPEEKRQRSWKGSAPTARASPRDRLDILLLYIIFCHINNQ